VVRKLDHNSRERMGIKACVCVPHMFYVDIMRKRKDKLLSYEAKSCIEIMKLYRLQLVSILEKTKYDSDIYQRATENLRAMDSLAESITGEENFLYGELH